MRKSPRLRGKLTAITPLPPANATFAYSISNSLPSAVTTSTLNDDGTSAISTTLYDSLLRVRQTQDPTPQGGSLVTDTFYDTHGWVTETDNKWWDQSNTPGTGLAPKPDDSLIPDQTVTEYDGLGRAVLVTDYDDSAVRSQTATVYDQAARGDGDETITVPLNASGQPYNGAPATATVTDALGRNTQLLQYTALPAVTVSRSASPVITTVTATGGTTQATDYGFDDTGNQTTVTDEATGQQWASAYNLLGQVTSRTDPDSGTTSDMTYDSDGNLLQSTDANGKTLSWTYDALNRKTAEYDAAASAQSGSNQLAAWAYDNSNNAVSGMANPDGQLTTATRYVGGTSGSAYTQQATGFTDSGEPTGENITIPPSEGALAGTYKFAHSYYPISGAPYRDAYQASPGGGELPAETVTHGYAYVNALQLPTGLGGLDNYGSNITWTPFGQVGQEVIGTNSVYADITNTYDPNTGALTDTQLKNPNVSATPIDETSYKYDAAGNPIQQTETRQG